MFELRPESSGLLIVDMQNDFVREGAPSEVPEARKKVSIVADMLKACRTQGVFVAFTRYVSTPRPTFSWRLNPRAAPPTSSLQAGHMRRYDDVRGARDCTDVIDELQPLATEPAIVKFGYSAFHNTNLADLLRGNQVTQLIIVGTMTEVCVEDTARGAYHEGFEAVIVEDAVASLDPALHDAALRTLATHYCRVATSKEVLAELASSGAQDVMRHKTADSLITDAPA